MTTLPLQTASDQTTGLGPVDEGARRAFEKTWHEGSPQPLDRFLPGPADPMYLPTLVELVQIELELAWKAAKRPAGSAAGPAAMEPPRVEAYLDRFPPLAAPAVLLQLIRQEYDVRRRFAEAPPAEEYRARFPALIVTGRELEEPAEATGGAAPAPLPDVPGYRVLGVLGHGGMGVVYRATQLSLDRDVALKVLSAGPLASPEDLERFRAEAQAVARLQDPNIVQIFEVGEFAGHPYLALELVDGGSLAQKLGRSPLPPRQAAQWAETLARTVQRLHEHGIVHRDLKPANVLLTREGVLKVSDFGLARRLDAPSGHTQTGAVLGTPSYASPEQAAGRARQVGPAADVYALGAILYEMLTGRPPFRAASSVDTILQVLKDEPVSVTRLQPKVSRDLETICHKCLRKEREKRYPTAAALAEDLRRYLAGEPILARPVGRLGRAWRWSRRNPALAGTGVLAAAALLACAAVSAAAAVYNARAARAIAAEQKQTRAALAAERAERLRSGELAASLMLNQSVGFCQDGDVRAGVLWMARCLQVAPPESRDLEWAVRAGLGAWARELNAPAAPPLRHQGSVVAAAFSRDGARVVTGGEDQTARLWDARTGNAVARPLRHRDAVRAVAFSPDGRLVLTGSDDGTARLWLAATGAPAGPALQHRLAVRFALFTPDGKTVATGSDDGTAQLWDAATGNALAGPLDAGGRVEALALSPDGRVLAAAAGSEVRRWDTATGRPAGEPLRAGQPVLAVAFSADGRTIATGGGVARSGEARLWDAGAGQTPSGGTPSGGTQDVGTRSAEVRSAGTQTAETQTAETRGAGTRGAETQSVETYGAETRGVVLPHPDRVTAVAFPRGGAGGLLVTACDDGAARLWDAGSGRPAGVPLRHREGFAVRAVAFGGDGKLVATGSADGTARAWDAATGRPVGPALNLESPVRVVAFGPDGRTLLTAGDDRTARLWSIAGGQSAGPAVPLGEAARPTAVSADGRLRLVVNGDGAAVLEDAATGKPLGPALRHEGPSDFERQVTCAALGPDGRFALTGGRDQKARLWKAATGEPVGQPLPYPGAIRAVALAPDGRTAAVGGEDRSARLGDAVTGRPVGKPLPQRGPVLSLAFSPDGRLLLAGCGFVQDGAWRGQARVWDVAAGVSIGQAMRHAGAVAAVAFSPDGRVAATGGFDRTARCWEAATGRALGPPLEHPGEVTAAAFAPDGRTLVTVCRESPGPGPAATRPAAAPGARPATGPAAEARRGFRFVWQTPAAVAGDAERVAVWAQVVTGLEFDPTNVIRRLDDEAWAASRQRLDSLGGPPEAGGSAVVK